MSVERAPERRRYTVISLVFQYVSMALSVAQGLILVPLFLRYLSLPLYGAWLAMSNAVVWITMLDPGVSAVFQQRIGAAFGRRDKAGVASAAGTGLALNALIYLALLAAAAAVAPLFPGLLHIQGDEARLLVRCFLLETLAEALLSLGMTAVSIPMAVMAYPVTVGVVYSGFTAAGLLLTAWLLSQGWGLLALPMGSLLRGGGLFVANVVLAALTFKNELRLTPRLSGAELKAVSSLTGYSWCGRLGEGLTGEVDAFLVGHLLGPAAVPVMTMTRNASDIIHQLASRVAAAFLPGLTHLHSERGAEGSKEITLRLLRVVAWTGALGAGGFLALNERFVGLWVGPALFGGRALTLLFAGLVLWQALGRALSRILFAFGRIRETSLSSAAEAALRAAALWALLSYGGGLAAVPAAGLIAAAATGGWVLPRLLRGELRLERGLWAGLAREILACSAGLAALGACWPRLTPEASGWAGFVLQALAFVAVSMAVLAAVSGEFRREAAALLKRLDWASRLNAAWKARALVRRNGRVAGRYAAAALRQGISYSEAAVLERLKESAARRAPPRGKPVVYWVGANRHQDDSGFLAALKRHASVHCFENSLGRYGPLLARPGEPMRLFEPAVAADNGRSLARGYERCRSELGKPDLLLGQMWANLFPVESLQKIRADGVPVVNIAMDDRLPEHWESRRGVALGSVGLAGALDLVLTTAPEACLRYEVAGCPSLFWPLGSDPALFEDLPQEARVHDVCFVGNKYGIRGRIVSALLEAGVSVTAYGAGWPNGPIGPEKAAPLFSRSKIVLGIGTIAHNEDQYTLKLRDFDGPMSGALYVTHRNPDLLRLYEEDCEIVCYSDAQECVSQVKRYLADAEGRARIARAGAAKARERYTWDRWVGDLFALTGLTRTKAPF